MILRLFLTIVLLITNTHVFAQGVAVFMPMAQSHIKLDSLSKFSVQNITSTPITLTIEPQCIIDKKAVEGKACLDYFEITSGGEALGTEISIDQGKSQQIYVKLKKTTGFTYALFKPKFVPKPDEEQKKEEGIRFTFGYQPGILYLAKNEKQNLNDIKFETYTYNKTKRAKFIVDTTKLDYPIVANATAMIKNKKNQKTIRFGRVASNKFFTPDRKQVQLELEYADSELKEEVCYGLYIENTHTKSMQKISNCEDKKSTEAH